jgi:hypothetical protein
MKTMMRGSFWVSELAMIPMLLDTGAGAALRFSKVSMVLISPADIL